MRPGPFAIAAGSAHEAWPVAGAGQDGSYVVAWQQNEAGTDHSAIFAREIDAAGFSPAVAVSIGGDTAFAPALAIAPLTDERIVSWTMRHSSGYLAYVTRWPLLPAGWMASGLVTHDLESTATAVASGTGTELVGLHRRLRQRRAYLWRAADVFG